MFIEWLTHDAKGTQNDITELAKLLFHRFHHCTFKVKTLSIFLDTNSSL